MTYLNPIIITFIIIFVTACGNNATHPTPDVAPTTATETANPSQPTDTPNIIPTTTDVSTIESSTESSVDDSVAIVGTRSPTITSEISQPALDASAEIASLLMAQIPQPSPPASEDEYVYGLDGVVAYPLTNIAGEYWLAHTYGVINYEIDQWHAIGVYQPSTDGWQEVDLLFLQDQPSYLDEQGIELLTVDDSSAWLGVHTGIGAHGGCFDLLKFDGQTLNLEFNSCSASPGAATISDVNADGTPDIVVDWSDPYVFCYACGVSNPAYQLLSWDGIQFSPVMLTTLSDDTEASQLNNQAIALAEANLLKAATETIHQALKLDRTNTTIAWNTYLIDLPAETLQMQLGAESPYPLVINLFYGDYPATLELFRPYSPAEIFTIDSPLIIDTVASGWEDALGNYFTTYTNSALQLQPELASAYFLRAWGAYLVEPTNPTIVADLQQAVTLDPDEPLYQESLAYLSQ